MSDGTPPGSPDEPVIGANFPVIGAQQPGDDYADLLDPTIGDEDEDAYDEYETPAYDDELDPYYGRRYDEAPARQPLFYVFIGLAAIVGAAAIFALFTVVRSGDDDDAPPTPAADLQVQITSPKNGERLRTSQALQVTAQASANQPLARFELYLDDKLADQVDAVAPATGDIYTSNLKAQVTKRGDHTIYVRAITTAGAKKDTSKVRLTFVEDLVDRPSETARVRVVATTTLRGGPGDQFDAYGTIEAGTEVRAIGRTSDGEWLLVDREGGRWIKRAAIQEVDSLVTVPVREPLGSPTPATSTATAQVTPVTTPAPSGLPDFVPADARFVFAGGGRVSLRVSIRNEGGAYSGPLVVGISTVPGGLTSPQFVFDVNLGGGRVTTVDFDLLGRAPARADVTVRIDPANAIREASEDNNSAVFSGVPAPADPPDLVLTGVNVTAQGITVVVQNNGGNMPASNIRVRVTVGGQERSQSKNQSLNTGQSVTFSFDRFATGTGKVELFLNDVATASTNLNVPGSETPSATATTPTGTATATATASPSATGSPSATATGTTGQ